MEHWKFGSDFAIRYGGYADIQWFKGEDFDNLSQHLAPPASAMPASQAVAFSPSVVIEALKVAALFLQWWEMRKQTAISSAAFEERRHQWIAELLAQLSTEMQNGSFRGDTVRYLDRECGKMLIALSENSNVDVPSALLLQLERLTDTLVSINNVLDHQRSQLDRPNVAMQARILLDYQYVPYFNLIHDKSNKQVDDQLKSGLDILKTVPVGIGVAVGVAAGIGGPIVMPLVGAGVLLSTLWTAFASKRENLSRQVDLQALINLQIELRSSAALLHLLRSMRPRYLTFSFSPQGEGGLLELTRTALPAANK